MDALHEARQLAWLAQPAAVYNIARLLEQRRSELESAAQRVRGTLPGDGSWEGAAKTRYVHEVDSRLAGLAYESAGLTAAELAVDVYAAALAEQRPRAAAAVELADRSFAYCRTLQAFLSQPLPVATRMTALNAFSQSRAAYQTAVASATAAVMAVQQAAAALRSALAEVAQHLIAPVELNPVLAGALMGSYGVMGVGTLLAAAAALPELLAGLAVGGTVAAEGAEAALLRLLVAGAGRVATQAGFSRVKTLIWLSLLTLATPFGWTIVNGFAGSGAATFLSYLGLKGSETSLANSKANEGFDLASREIERQNQQLNHRSNDQQNQIFRLQTGQRSVQDEIDGLAKQNQDLAGRTTAINNQNATNAETDRQSGNRFGELQTQLAAKAQSDAAAQQQITQFSGRVGTNSHLAYVGITGVPLVGPDGRSTSDPQRILTMLKENAPAALTYPQRISDEKALQIFRQAIRARDAEGSRQPVPTP